MKFELIPFVRIGTKINPKGGEILYSGEALALEEMRIKHININSHSQPSDHHVWSFSGGPWVQHASCLPKFSKTVDLIHSTWSSLF